MFIAFVGDALTPTGSQAFIWIVITSCLVAKQINTPCTALPISDKHFLKRLKFQFFQFFSFKPNPLNNKD